MNEDHSQDMAVVLARMDERLAGLVRELTKANENFKESIKDHDSRLRVIEKWMWALPLSFIIGIVSAIISIKGN